MKKIPSLIAFTLPVLLPVSSLFSANSKEPISVRVAAYNVEFGKNASPEKIGKMFKPYNFDIIGFNDCLLYTSPSPRDAHESRMPSSA